ncbi:MAG: hypothetical protein QOJ57_1725 [Thermoleophilaceae bacterium]|jgi:uncharacterized RDD family membrane protein YckC|nr:hypothetical protein [Thermoleophilaceae bacterium]
MTLQGAAADGARAVTADSTEVVGRRIGALLIDGVLLGIVFFVVGLATGGGHSGHGRASIHLGGSATLVFLGITLAYFLICEGATGQTLGKRLIGIRVVSADGSRASWGQVLARTVLRIVDALPIFYIVGLITVLATGRGRRQRVGDLAAGTLVVSA